MSDLLSCPFCGSDAEVIGTQTTIIRCTDDQCISRCDMGGYNNWGHSADAITAWNTRVASHPATSTPVVSHKQPETSDNDLVERVARAIEPQIAIDEALLASPQHLRKLKAHRVAQAAIAIIEQDRAALVAEIVAWLEDYEPLLGDEIEAKWGKT